MKQRRGIRRVVIRTGIFLLLGAIVNVAVAWGCVCWSPSAANHDRLSGCKWIGSVPSDWPATPVMRGAFDGFGYEEDLVIWSRQPRARRSDTGYWQLAERSGWPARSLSVVRSVAYTEDALPNGPATAPRRSLEDGIAIPEFVPYRIRVGWRSLPAQLLWPGFAINTIFYAAILWLLFAAPFAFRRRRRIKRDLCPACAYPVGISDLCTECGKSVKSTTD